MAQQILFANNAQTTLAGSITNTDTTANLDAGSGALFPNPGTGQYYVMTFVDPDTLVKEIVWVTLRVGDAITMVRGKEGTTAVAWPAGSVCANLITAGALAQFAQLGGLTGYANVAIYEIQSGVQKISINGGAFTTTGATSFAPPLTNIAEISGCGGGGAGGGTQATGGGQVAAAGGGGAGAQGAVRLINLTTATTVTVGAGGVAVSDADGGSGGQSSFGTYLILPGGDGGSRGIAITPPFVSGAGLGGNTATAPVSPTVIALNLAGGDTGDVGLAMTVANLAGGAGASCLPYGSGGSGTAGGAGSVGDGAGAGGSGASSLPSAAARIGGDGSSGRIVVRW